MSAQSYAEDALALAQADKHGVWRASMVAGRAAHSGSREDPALDFYRLSERAAGSPREKRDALWGQLMCASALELPEAHELLAALESSTVRSDAHELVRMADKKLGMDFRFGAIRNLGNARQVSELVPHVADPFVRCSFRCAYACALTLSAHYREAHAQALELLKDVEEFRVDPALPYAHSMLAASLAGLGHHNEAHLALDAALREARRCNDEFGLQCIYASRVRVLLQEGRAKDACAIEPPDLEHALKSIKGEVLASRGLALATLGRLDEAKSARVEATSHTNGVEARVLAAAIDAVCAVNGLETGKLDAVDELLEVAFETRAVDLLVTAYRANPDLLSALLASAVAMERAMYVVARAGDEPLMNALGRESEAIADPMEKLSPREHDVYSLICEGLTNREIAQRLFITEGTVKVHVHHLFDKFGIRSRTALAMNAARDRWRQAASAVTSDGSEPSTASESDRQSLPSSST